MARTRSSSFQQQKARMDSLFDHRGDAPGGKKRKRGGGLSDNLKANKSKAEKKKAKKKKKNAEKKQKKIKTRFQPERKKRSRQDSGESNHKNKTSKRARFHFPFPRVIPSTIFWKRTDASDPYTLDNELLDFADYVRLGQEERAVRDAWTAKLHRISPVEVFGSHSVPAVCAFCSDLDVYILEKKKEEPKAASKPRILPASPEKEDAESLRESQKVKLQRKNRWIEALGALDEGADKSSISNRDDEKDDIEQDEETDMFQIDRKGSAVSASSSSAGKLEDTDSDEDSADPLGSAVQSPIVASNNEQPHVSYSAEKVQRSARPMTKPQVLRVLRDFRNRMHKSYRNLIARSQVINARVPIIKMSTVSGCETDIACGGHRGNDTSLYAASKVEESESFAPLVLFLKILMNQHGLDVPFDGGLGSYKLYVLVSDHCRRHAGKPTGEILLSFLMKFSNPNSCGLTRLNDGSRVFIGSDGSSADLSNVYRWNECCALLASALDLLNRSNYRLGAVIDGTRLRGDRELVHEQHCGVQST